MFYIYLLGSHIFQVLAGHDAPELGFNEPLRSFPFCRPGEEQEEERMNPGWQHLHSTEGKGLG